MPDDPREPVLVLANAATVEEAETIAERLVGDEVAASVNIHPQVVSFYRWKGELRRALEATLVVKTTRGRAARAIETIERLHSYEVPPVLVVAVEGGGAAYLSWLADQPSGSPAVDRSSQ